MTADRHSTSLGATDLRRLGREIKQAQWRHHRAVDRGLAPIGSTLVQWDALRAIRTAPGSSGHELAQLTFQSDQSFSTLATRMISAGLIERTPGRGRRAEHRLTPLGDDVLERGQVIVDGILDESFAGLADDERGTLLRLLLQLRPV